MIGVIIVVGILWLAAAGRWRGQWRLEPQRSCRCASFAVLVCELKDSGSPFRMKLAGTLLADTRRRFRPCQFAFQERFQG